MRHTFPFPKDPDEKLDYQYDWSNELAPNETITSFDFEILTGNCSIESSSIDPTNKKVNFRLVGGLKNEINSIVNTINTSSGQILQRTSFVKIGDR